MKTGGTVTCWGGDDTDGQVSGIVAGTYTLISAGTNHTCGVKTDGSVSCWGADLSGQVSGIVAGLYTSVSAGGGYTCGVKTDATVACWGEDTGGQVSGIVAGTYISVSAGSGGHTCGVKTSGTVACWGFDGAGQVSGISPGAYTSVSVGNVHTCGVKTDGAAACWGFDHNGDVSGIVAGTYTSVSAGVFHTCGVKTGGAVACWGDNRTDQVSPIPAGTYTSVSAGLNHTCGVKTDGTMSCWGDDDLGQVSEIPTEFLGLDFGDAPDSYGTSLGANGARHTMTGPRLGVSVEADTSGHPSADALGDDSLDGSDDEDGVTFDNPVYAGASTKITVVSSEAGNLDGWIDVNSDGDWTDPGEQVLVAEPLAPGSNALGFTLPTNNVLGSTFMRFRLSSDGFLSPFGAAPDGEVEDYEVEIIEVPEGEFVCGMTAAGKVSLTANLTDCPGDGLVIGANKTKIALNGFTISGMGEGIGINNRARYDGISIKGPGTITGFERGVVLSRSDKSKLTGFTVTMSDTDGVVLDTTVGSKISKVVSSDNDGTGILVSGSKNSVAKSTANDNDGDGINAIADASVKGKKNTAQFNGGTNCAPTSLCA